MRILRYDVHSMKLPSRFGNDIVRTDVVGGIEESIHVKAKQEGDHRTLLLLDSCEPESCDVAKNAQVSDRAYYHFARKREVRLEQNNIQPNRRRGYLSV